eukprot:TRINITY_DN33042_c0_g2_i1.p1 TRINITY_DN33042_c0_g2~~TRINITY_DN33042_c0_g2_i1.p1  ORF type:complete len:460 (-),score=124.05 TRINITY_DN33042_c0_g2_i1:112-1491(-)
MAEDNKGSRSRTASPSKPPADDGADPTDAVDALTSPPKGGRAASNANPEELLQAFFGSKPSAAARGFDPTKVPHAFWDSQPVPKFDQAIAAADPQGPIDPEKTVDEIKKKPYKLPAQFEWSDCDVSDEKVLDEIYDLLNKNYVEDDDNMFRFDYSKEFLHWALTPPGYHHNWHVGVRVKDTGKLVAFITGVPATVHIYQKSVTMAEINFLCVHKKLRSKRLAPVLIKEITRRVNRRDIWQAVYTAGVVLPRPVGRNRYWHRSLKPGKLVDVKFSHIPRNLTKASMIKLYRLPSEPVIPGLRLMEERDVPEANELLQNYLQQFDLHVSMTDEEFKHWLLPRPNVITTYVVEDPKSKKITDMLSFYTLCSTIIGHDKHKTLRAAYSFYNVPGANSLKDLVNDALIVAAKDDFDVYNALDVMENASVMKELKFGIGDGNLQYYLYNWACPEMPANKVGLVLL